MIFGTIKNEVNFLSDQPLLHFVVVRAVYRGLGSNVAFLLQTACIWTENLYRTQELTSGALLLDPTVGLTWTQTPSPFLQYVSRACHSPQERSRTFQVFLKLQLWTDMKTPVNWNRQLTRFHHHLWNDTILNWTFFHKHSHILTAYRVFLPKFVINDGIWVIFFTKSCDHWQKLAKVHGLIRQGWQILGLVSRKVLDRGLRDRSSPEIRIVLKRNVEIQFQLINNAPHVIFPMGCCYNPEKGWNIKTKGEKNEGCPIFLSVSDNSTYTQFKNFVVVGQMGIKDRRLHSLCVYTLHLDS